MSKKPIDLEKLSDAELDELYKNRVAKRAPAEARAPEKLEDLSDEQLDKMYKERVVGGSAPKEKPGVLEQVEGVARSVLSDPIGVVAGGAMSPEARKQWAQRGIKNPIAEPLIAGVKAVGKSLYDSDPTERAVAGKKGRQTLSELGSEIADNYRQEIQKGKEYQKQYPVGDLVETAGRSVAETASFGLSEPVVSGYRAIVESAIKGGSVHDSFAKDRQAREKMQENLPIVDIPAQVAGAFLGPTGVLRKAGSAALEKFAPGLVDKSAKAVSNYFTSNPNTWKKVVTWLATTGGGNDIVSGAAKGAVDIAEQEAARNLTLGKTGFINEEEQANPLSAAKTGAYISAGLNALPTAYRGAKALGIGAMGPFLGVQPTEARRYLENFDRLKNKKSSLTEVADEVQKSLNMIKEEVASKRLSADQAKEEFKKFQDAVKDTMWGEKDEIQKRLTKAQEELDLAARSNKYTIKQFGKMLPQQHYQEVAASVDDLAEQAVAAKATALNVLRESNEKISVGNVDKFLKKAEANLAVVGKGKDKQGFSVTANQALERVRYYRAQMAKLNSAHPKGIPAKKLRDIIDQLDNDLNSEQFKELGNIASAGEVGLFELRKILDDKLDAVPGWAEAIALSAESAQALSRAKDFFKDPDAILSQLHGIGDVANARSAEALLELGKRTGKDFSGIIEKSKEIRERLENPEIQAAIKAGMPQQQQIAKLQEELAPYNRPQARVDMINQRSAGAEQKMIEAKAAADEAESVLGTLNNWNSHNTDTKIKAIMRGKDALRTELGRLGQLTDKQLVETVDDLRTLGTFDKRFRVGSANTNYWGLLGAVMAPNPNQSSQSRGWWMVAMSSVGRLIDEHGPQIARKILNGIAGIEGIVTLDKIRRLPLPKHVVDDLGAQFTRAIYSGVEAPEPFVQATPEEAAVLRSEIGKSNLSVVDKAQQIDRLNRTGQASVQKVIMGNDNSVVDRTPVNSELQWEEVGSQPAAQEQLTPPTAAEILSRIRRSRGMQ